MKQKCWLLLFLLLLTACGLGVEQEVATPVEVETAVMPAEQEAATPAESVAEATEVEIEPTEVPPAPTDEPAAEAAGEVTAVPPITPATTGQAAAEVRPQDQVKGSEDGVVVIVEYGDFQ